MTMSMPRAIKTYRDRISTMADRVTPDKRTEWSSHQEAMMVDAMSKDQDRLHRREIALKRTRCGRGRPYKASNHINRELLNKLRDMEMKRVKQELDSRFEGIIRD